MKEELNIGCDYTYVFPNEDDDYEYMVSGTIIYNDGEFAIMKVDDLDTDCEVFVSNYSVVKKYFPEFNDPEANDHSEYFCLTADKGSFIYLDPNYWVRMEGNIEVGSIFTYGTYSFDLFDCSLRGVVVYNDGETAVLRLIKEEHDIEILLESPNRPVDVDFFSYDELHDMNPDFNDPEANENTKYFLIDVETRELINWYDLYDEETSEDTTPTEIQPSSDEDLPF